MNRSSARLSRRPAVREPRPEIVVVCEGKVTEPQYFQEFRNMSGNALVTVTAVGGCGVPTSVVERAIQERDDRRKSARKTRDSFDLLFEVWAVFDRDAHPDGQVPNAFALARRNGIKVAYSNPCFEVWGLMHFMRYARPGHHHECQRELKNLLSGYCHEKNPVLNVKALASRYQVAVRHAQDALRDRKLEGSPQGDPSTGVFELTERIREYGKA